MMRIVFLCSVLLISFSQVSFAADIRRVTKKAVIVTGATPEDGMSKGAKVCFYDGDKNVGCGKVVHVRKGGKIVYIRASEKIKKSLRKGFSVRASEGSSVASDTPSKGSYKLWGLGSAAIMTPSSYTKPAYIPHDSEAPVSLWDQEDATTQSLQGFGFAVGIPIGRMMIIPGMRYRFFTGTVGKYDLFESSAKNRYVEVVQSATSMSFYTDLAFLNFHWGSSFDFYLSSGLDFDMSTVKVVATQKDDGSNPVPEDEFTSLESTLSLLGLRLGANLDYMVIKNLGLNFGMNAVIPVAEISSSTSGEVDDTSAPDMKEQTEDLATAIDHKKASAGFEIVFGLVLAI